MNLPEAFTPKLVTAFREGYGTADLRADALAGLTVAIVALPLAMALGIASGASPREGLVTAIVAGLLISALGGSRVQIGGPTGAFVVIVAGVIAAHGFDGLILATLMAGLILIVSGYAGVGRLMRYVPMPVVTGFTAGIAVIIASSQVGDFLGLRAGNVPADFVDKWGAYGRSIATVNWTALALGVATLGIIVGVRRLTPRAPAQLIAILAATMFAALLHLPVETVGDRFHAMATGVPLPHMPRVTFPLAREVLAERIRDRVPRRHRGLALGDRRRRDDRPAAPFGAGAGRDGRRQHRLGLVRRIARDRRDRAHRDQHPRRCALADGRHFPCCVPADLHPRRRQAARAGADDRARRGAADGGVGDERDTTASSPWCGPTPASAGVLVLTFLLTVFVDLTVAIGVGVTLAALLFMRRMSETAGLVAMDPAEEPELRAGLPAGVEVLRFTGPIFFGVASEMLEALRRSGQRPRAIILRMEEVPYIDATGANALATFVTPGEERGDRDLAVRIEGAAARVSGQIRAALCRRAARRELGGWAAAKGGRMKALLSHEPGGPETLRLTELPDPQARPGELLVRVRACAINYPDVLIIEDKYQLKPPRPFAPGSEIAGEVIAVGEGADGWSPATG